ncbi:phospholipase D-like domain-containing protein [candidate division CSSED10-310 bacterium]|uniref:phospholipase D n=1 Tax=candidate division CSSED10-310 bacterium TaxID=2855610 RepID=A0ABV6Z3H4_UNCC1
MFSLKTRAKSGPGIYALFFTIALIWTLSPVACTQRQAEHSQNIPSPVGANKPRQNIAGTDEAALVVPLNNRSYYPRVLTLIQQAQENIEIIMYQIRFYSAYPDSKSNTLIAALAQAQKRGVKVQILIESSDWNPENALANKIAGHLLTRAGVSVRYDDPEVNSHNKLLIIDGEIVVLGSSNWSYHSLDKNNETAVAIRSTSVAKQYHEYFLDLFDASSEQYPLLYPSVSARQLPQQGVVTIEGIGHRITPSLYSAVEFSLVLDNNCTINFPSTITDELYTLLDDFPDCLIGKKLTLVVKIQRRERGMPHITLLTLEQPSLTELVEKKIKQLRLEVPEDDQDFWHKASKAVSIILLNDEDYLPTIMEVFAEAQQSIKLIQIQSDYFIPGSRAKEPATNMLLNSLRAAVKRGVTVEFLTDYRHNEQFRREKKAFLHLLQSAGGFLMREILPPTVSWSLLMGDC